jgi:hypothetical protein
VSVRPARVVVLGGEHQWRAVLMVAGIGIGVVRQQKAHDLVLPGVGRINQRGVACLVLGIDGDALIDPVGRGLLSPPRPRPGGPLAVG